jgi:hypothetical protein
MANNKPTSGIAAPTSDQGKNIAIRGGMPPKKSADAIATVNTPSARKAAPDSFRP